MADEERRRVAQTTATVVFSPLLRKLQQDEWTPDVEQASPPTTERFVAGRGARVGKYVLEDKLGQGTFGRVFTARDTDLDRRVAFKILNPTHQHNAEVVTRFLQEARATAKINHVGIVTILDVGRIQTDLGDLAYIVMELLEGETLSRRVDRCGQLQTAETIEIAHQIAGALGAAHRVDVLHRDVKPDNIVLVRDPVLASGERVKVLDFGLAKVDGGAHTLTNTILGTPRYMSPEQTRSSASIDRRSDIYSLGIVMFEMLVGRRPFEGDLATLIHRHQREIPPRVISHVPSVPKALDDLVARMLAKDLKARPQTMEDVQAELVKMSSASAPVGRSTQAITPVVEAKVKPSNKKTKAKEKERAHAREQEREKAKRPLEPAAPLLRTTTPESEPVLVPSIAPPGSVDSIDGAGGLNLVTVVAFPPPPSLPTEDSLDAQQTTVASAVPQGGTVARPSERSRDRSVAEPPVSRRRSLPTIAAIAFGAAFVMVAIAVLIGRTDGNEALSPRPTIAPAPPAPPAPVEPATPAPVPLAEPVVVPAAPAKAEAPTAEEPAIDKVQIDPVDQTAGRAVVNKQRKRPPVPPVKKEKWTDDSPFMPVRPVKK